MKFIGIFFGTIPNILLGFFYDVSLLIKSWVWLMLSLIFIFALSILLKNNEIKDEVYKYMLPWLLDNERV